MATIPSGAIVQFEETAYSPTGTATIMLDEVLNAITRSGILRSEFTNEGVKAKILSPGGQWQDGVIRLSMDFTPTIATAPRPIPGV